jgi:hypothetical protein
MILYVFPHYVAPSNVKQPIDLFMLYNLHVSALLWLLLASSMKMVKWSSGQLLIVLLCMSGVHIFSKSLGATIKLQVLNGRHDASSILRTHKY